MTYQARPGYVTRTLQGLSRPEGALVQPITLRKAMEGGWNIELLIDVPNEVWSLITKIEIHKQDPVLISVEDLDVSLGTKYVNAIRARVRKDQ